METQRPRTLEDIQKNIAVNGKTITPMTPHRLELEIEKLLAASHYVVAPPDGMPCDNLAELSTSTPVLLSFGMFQNIIYVYRFWR
jgi:hypothetical protein